MKRKMVEIIFSIIGITALASFANAETSPPPDAASYNQAVDNDAQPPDNGNKEAAAYGICDSVGNPSAHSAECSNCCCCSTAQAPVNKDVTDDGICSAKANARRNQHKEGATTGVFNGAARNLVGESLAFPIGMRHGALSVLMKDNMVGNSGRVTLALSIHRRRSNC